MAINGSVCAESSDDAARKAEDKKKEAVLEAKEEIIRLKSEHDKEVRDRRNEVQRQERRINQREEAFDKKFDNLEAREESLNEKFKEVQRLEEEAQAMHEGQQAELERISNMTMEEARQCSLRVSKRKRTTTRAVSVREIEQRARDEAEKKARNIIGGRHSALCRRPCGGNHGFCGRSAQR